MKRSAARVKVELRIGRDGPSVRVWRRDGNSRTFGRHTGAKDETVKDLVLRSLADVEEAATTEG